MPSTVVDTIQQTGKQVNFMLRVIAFLLVLGCLKAQPEEPSLAVSGDVPTSYQLTQAQMSRLPHKQVSVNQHGKLVQYEGVAVHEILQKAGVPLGKAMTGKPMASYLLVTGRDGYQVVLALPEIDPAFQATQVLLADRENGAALPEKEAPFRLIVPQDKMMARSIYSVIKLEVVRLRK